MTDKLKRFVREDMPERRVVPDRRAPGWYEELVRELNEHADRLEARLHRFFFRCMIAFAIIGVATSISLVGFALTLRSHEGLTKAIQEQRREAIFRNCSEQNQRNSNTKMALIQGSEADIRNAPSKEAANEVRRRLEVALGLIDALAPRADCVQAVKTAVKGG